MVEAATADDTLRDERLLDWQSNDQFFEFAANLAPGELELGLRQRISKIEEVLQRQRERYAELEGACVKAEAIGDDAAYEMYELQWEQVEENIAMLETELNAVNQIMQEKYYQQRVATAQSGSRQRVNNAPGGL